MGELRDRTHSENIIHNLETLDGIVIPILIIVVCVLTILTIRSMFLLILQTPKEISNLVAFAVATIAACLFLLIFTEVTRAIKNLHEHILNDNG
jgi:hypothetical protein